MNSDSDPPPTYSSAVSDKDVVDVTVDLEHKEPLLPSAPPPAQESGSTPTPAPTASSTFFDQAIAAVPSSLRITHGSDLYANDTEYSMRAANGTLVFSATVDEVGDLKVIRFKNWERRSVFVVKLRTPPAQMHLDICTQDGVWKFASINHDFKSREYSKLEILKPQECAKSFTPMQRSEDDFGLRDPWGKMVATAHIQKTYPVQAQQSRQSGAAQEVEVSLNITDQSLNAYEKTAVLAWGLFWVILSRMGEKSVQSSMMCCACLALVFFVVLPFTIYLVHHLVSASREDKIPDIYEDS